MLLEQCEMGDFDDQELREQAEGTSNEDILLRAWSDSGGEEALAMLSFLSDTEAQLEKLYVPHAQRGRGIASRTLVAVEEYCRKRQITTIKLWAKPLDDDTDQLWLINWYKKRGYVESGKGFAELQKIL